MREHDGSEARQVTTSVLDGSVSDTLLDVTTAFPLPVSRRTGCARFCIAAAFH